MSFFVGSTREEQRRMLQALGLASVEELFSVIPPEYRTEDFDLPDALPESEVLRLVRELAGRNNSGLINFCGGGYYDHFIPPAVDALTTRGEFFTAYTPYQAEASQGTLQAIFEFQTAVARLTGMEVANASLYDGGSALFEAVMMSLRLTRRTRILVDTAVNPLHRRMFRTYSANTEVEIVEVPHRQGITDLARISEEVQKGAAAVVAQYPNFFGVIEDLTPLAEIAHEHGALLIVSFYPIALGLLRPPGDMGADIVVGEGQSLGLPLNFGGPYLGMMATRKQYVRQMPGRIVGATRDESGRRGYVLTLQAREQHIRREKATSNICTNEGLCALRAVIYLALLGETGLRQVARSCAHQAHRAADLLCQIEGVQPAWARPFFNEFVLQLPVPAGPVCRRLLQRGLAPGIPLGDLYPGYENRLLVAVTEQRSLRDIQRLADGLAEALREESS